MNVMKRWIRLLAPMMLISFLAPACGEGSIEQEMFDNSRPERLNILPKWLTEEEQNATLGVQRLSLEATVPPPVSGMRSPAEYEPARAVVMTYTAFRTMVSELSQHVADAGAEVWLIGGPSSIPGVPAELYRRLPYAYDTVWARDYGPYGIHESTLELGIVDTAYTGYYSRTNDDAVPCKIAADIGAQCYTTNLILDGGNFASDGNGNLFMSTATYEWNDNLSTTTVDNTLKSYYGVHTIHAFPIAKDSYGQPADGTGHIDMYMKPLAPCKVMVAEYNQEPFYSKLEAIADYFENLPCATGQTYQVYRVPGWYDGAWYTYTNSLIVNQSVLVPGYQSGNDDQARAVYEQALPGYTVAIVNSDDAIRYGGAIHCVTKEVPAPEAQGNRVPYARAGDDQAVLPGDTVSLDGSASYDPDGDALVYQWVQVAGPLVALSDDTSAQPSFIAPAVTDTENLVFELTVTDGALDSQPDSVTITVTPSSGGNIDITNDTSIAIPDSYATGITSPIQVNQAGVIDEVEVEVDISHPWVGAVRIRLECPNGSTSTTLRS